MVYVAPAVVTNEIEVYRAALWLDYRSVNGAEKVYRAEGRLSFLDYRSVNDVVKAYRASFRVDYRSVGTS